uniref:Golgi integral membrane protein 4 n=1 Tax=Callithrix jacchus TaxID=9483 RepID=A0A8I3ZZV4_CALJA
LRGLCYAAIPCICRICLLHRERKCTQRSAHSCCHPFFRSCIHFTPLSTCVPRTETHTHTPLPHTHITHLPTTPPTHVFTEPHPASGPDKSPAHRRLPALALPPASSHPLRLHVGAPRRQAAALSIEPFAGPGEGREGAALGSDGQSGRPIEPRTASPKGGSGSSDGPNEQGARVGLPPGIPLARIAGPWVTREETAGAAAALGPGGTMGNGMCSRKQKRIFQTLLLLTVVFGFLYGAMLYYELQTQLRKAEAVALKYQQHQESLSAQLQVVYEHRSRLEKSLQKERLEHKKAKEDFLVYKLEAQETLNKGRQDSNSRYSALNVQHQMLKSQHEELKKQHSDLEEEHRKQGEDFSRTFNDHKQKYLQLQQEKEQELSKLKGIWKSN